ncbi:DUF5131 family protein [Roseibium album]|uniref:DUF5131 family protein n=1 Tax=Roseibium album TaxID=311410 RepID=UPI00391CFFFA
MADNSTIEWIDATWNPITGCTLVSKGCDNCYAAELAASRLMNTPESRAPRQSTFTGRSPSNVNITCNPWGVHR